MIDVDGRSYQPIDTSKSEKWCVNFEFLWDLLRYVVGTIPYLRYVVLWTEMSLDIDENDTIDRLSMLSCYSLDRSGRRVKIRTS